jgi:NAD(P)-dependent dehydrogenase (short-subunit alcohol dehydrogenase family)
MISFAADQIILVTGASSGIGEAIALRCNALGATVIASGRSEERLAANKAKAAFPERFHGEIRELTEDMDELPQWVTALRAKYGKFTGLVPCAGVSGLPLPLREYTRQQANAFFDIHFHAPLLLAKGFCDRRNNVGKGASIVFMSSGGALARVAGLSMYGGAKSALMTASVVLSKEYASQGIRVNALAPALVQTPMGLGFLDFISPEAKEEELRLYPLGLGEPDDVASMAAFLLSSQARWITGQTIVMDGGRY